MPLIGPYILFFKNNKRKWTIRARKFKKIRLFFPWGCFFEKFAYSKVNRSSRISKKKVNKNPKYGTRVIFFKQKAMVFNLRYI